MDTTLTERAFPWIAVRPSAAVDLLTFAAGRPAMRLQLVRDGDLLRQWAEAMALSFATDGDYAVVARDGVDASQILAVDRSTDPHTTELGILLGYPGCCAKAAARWGEDRLDDAAQRMQRSERLQLLDITRYGEGIALVSHIPCAPGCVHSLRASRAAFEVARKGCSDPATASRWHRIVEEFRDDFERASR